eukprot:4035382-Lingulodinium_polyedra.AAC.1
MGWQGLVARAVARCAGRRMRTTRGKWQQRSQGCDQPGGAEAPRSWPLSTRHRGASGRRAA